MNEIKEITPEDLKRIVKCLESLGLKKGVDFDVKVFPSGLTDIFIGDIKTERKNEETNN